MHNAAEEVVSAHDASAGYFAGWNQCKGHANSMQAESCIACLGPALLAGVGERQHGPQKDQARPHTPGGQVNQSCSDIAVKKETRDKLG